MERIKYIECYNTETNEEISLVGISKVACCIDNYMNVYNRTEADNLFGIKDAFGVDYPFSMYTDVFPGQLCDYFLDIKAHSIMVVVTLIFRTQQDKDLYESDKLSITINDQY